MARTFIRQVTQIKGSDAYTDNIAPTLANYETNVTNIEEDLNNLRSQAHNLLKNQAGNWYDDLNIPSALDTGTQRGVNDLNTDLHAVERKRVLVSVAKIVDITVPASASATSNLLLNSLPLAGETVTLDAKVYTFVAALTPVEGEVLIGASASATRDNLVAAINHGPGNGTLYSCAAAHPTCSAAAGAGSSLDATALAAGTAGNTIATTETLSDVLSVWTGATLAGGAGDVVILGALELPAPTTAAVGVVTTEGTVIAYLAGFGVASTTEVAGASAVSPKNLWPIVDADLRDPILSGGRVIYALGQCETVTDGHTITAVTPTRAQLSFVRINAAGDDLELVPVADIAGKEISYTSVKRVALLNLTEQDFLRGAEVDVPSAVTPTRQLGYTNQGAVPVDVVTNSILDLEGPGLTWEIRDDLQASLFKITEGSAGGTTALEIGADVDSFLASAAVNSFKKGATFNTDGARDVRVGVSDGIIDTVAGDLEVRGTGELYLDDGNQVGSTWAQTAGIKLSDTTTEWDDFETAFGEVSILKAITMAADSDNRHRAVAHVTVNIAADTLIEGPNGPGVQNISADLLDYRNVTSFVDDVEIFVNGGLMRNGANAGANNDVYPSAVAGEQQYGCFYAEFPLLASPGNPDVIQMFINGAL